MPTWGWSLGQRFSSRSSLKVSPTLVTKKAYDLSKSSMCFLLAPGDTENHVCVSHREVENTISVDRPVVSGLALMCDKGQKVSFPSSGREQVVMEG